MPASTDETTRGGGALPPTYLLIGLIVMAGLHFLLSGPRLIVTPWRFAGVPLLLWGAWLAVRADALFKRLGTEVKPFRASRLVVDEGPYRYSRHPMYLGFIGILAGCAVLSGTLLPMLTLVVMVWLFTVRFVLPEEAHMEEQFGDEYRRYRSRVRMWF
jgi:protein-S-isoprenylcysteine O-methyltransferase Ste14